MSSNKSLTLDDMELAPLGSIGEGQGQVTRANQRPYLQESADFREMLIQKRKEVMTIMEGLESEIDFHNAQLNARRWRLTDNQGVLDGLNAAIAAIPEPARPQRDEDEQRRIEQET